MRDTTLIKINYIDIDNVDIYPDGKIIDLLQNFDFSRVILGTQQFDGSPNKAIITKVITWFKKLVYNEDVVQAIPIKIRKLVRIVAQTGYIVRIVWNTVALNTIALLWNLGTKADFRADFKADLEQILEQISEQISE
ncbi:hypothetical protein BGX38DRAFT_1140810 [Terfezia claveryi]|nr:hypothetical protein BGX38DRAFT_1140810 [Terfezia claveryi]